MAVGGSILGSIVIAILGYMLAKVNYPDRTSEWSAELLGVELGMGLSIPLVLIGGGLAGTWRRSATLLAHVNSWRATQNASIVAFVVGALVSGVMLVPTRFIMFIFENL